MTCSPAPIGPAPGVVDVATMAMMEGVVAAPELLWSRPVEGDRVAALMVDDRGQVAVSTSRERVESRAAGFDPMETISSSTPHGGWDHHNLYAHGSYCFDAGGSLEWHHGKVRIACAIQEGWAALSDRHDLVVINHQGVKTRGRRLVGDSWRICGWRSGEPIVSSDPDATWIAPYLYSAQGGQLRSTDEAGRCLATTDLSRAPFDEECRRDPPAPGLPDSFMFPKRMHLIPGRDQKSLIATHRLHMAWIASITLDGELAWVRLLDHACCNSACVVGNRIVHTSSCGGRVTVLGDDGRVLASRRVPHTLEEAIPDGRSGLCLRALDGVYGVDETLEPTWVLSTGGIPHVAARDGVIYVVAGQPSKLALSAYALA